MATCFCGCGREIGGLRARANNEVAGRMAQHLAVMRGALDRGDAGARTGESETMAADGAALLATIRRYLHGEIERDDLDRGRIKDWTKQGSRLASALVASGSGPRWHPDDVRTDHLAQAGQRASGVITDVRRNGTGNERVADLAVVVSATSTTGATIELTRSVSIAVVEAPRTGDRVEVAYDPADPNRFVYRPLVASTGDEPTSGPVAD